MPIIRVKRYTREDVQRWAPDLVVFGGNSVSRGMAGQARAARGFSHAVEIPTKREPSMAPTAFFTDADLPYVAPVIDRAFARLAVHLAKGGTVYWPADGVGTGLAQLPTRAPAIWAYLQTKFAELEQGQNQERAMTEANSPIVVAGTGHRPNKLGGYGKDVAERLKQLAVNYLNDVRPDRVISGMALGWDQALAEAAIELKIPFIAAVPFQGQESAWPAASQQHFRDLIAKAMEVVVVSPGGYEPWKMQKRNEWMVDKATHLASLWDGTSGGTKNCLDYARSQPHITIANLWAPYKGTGPAVILQAGSGRALAGAQTATPATQPQKTPILAFDGEHRFLSNFAPARVVFEGMAYPSVEHAYQAAKTADLGLRAKIAALPSPGAAKRAGKTLPLRPDWDRIKIDVMRDLVRQKFITGPEAAKYGPLIAATGDRHIVEGNAWGDRFWGESPVGNGQNHMGRILMELRPEAQARLRGQTVEAPAAAPAQANTSVAPKLRATMTFAYDGQARPEIKSPTTFDAILAGERTSTTRFGTWPGHERWLALNPGDVVRIYADKQMTGRFVDVRVKSTATINLANCDEKGLERWSRAEGWSPAAGRRFGQKYGAGLQIAFEPIASGAQLQHQATPAPRPTPAPKATTTVAQASTVLSEAARLAQSFSIGR